VDARISAITELGIRPVSPTLSWSAGSPRLTVAPTIAEFTGYRMYARATPVEGYTCCTCAAIRDSDFTQSSFRVTVAAFICVAETDDGSDRRRRWWANWHGSSRCDCIKKSRVLRICRAFEKPIELSEDHQGVRSNGCPQT